MMQEIGKCSLCGGPVMGYQGAWMSILPPPTPKCAHCGACPVGHVIPMQRTFGGAEPVSHSTSTNYTGPYGVGVRPFE